MKPELTDEKAAVVHVALPEPNLLSGLTDWDLDFRQITPGSGATRISIAQGRLFTQVRIKMPIGVHQRGSSPADQLTFGLPQRGSLVTWQGTDARALPFISFGSGQEFDGVSDASFEAVTLSIRKSDVEAFARDCGLELPDHYTAPAVLDLFENSWVDNLYRYSSDAFGSETAPQPAPEDEEVMAMTLLMALADAQTLEKTGSERMRGRVLRRALEVLDSETESPPSIRELCVLCGSSWPTLQRAFIERFGIGPKTYANALRLNRVRRDLIASGKSGKIADAANRWGFWHMGQLAKDYRKLFGRLPSEDLKH